MASLSKYYPSLNFELTSAETGLRAGAASLMAQGKRTFKQVVAALMRVYNDDQEILLLDILRDGLNRGYITGLEEEGRIAVSAARLGKHPAGKL
jgi:hypothetical protein